jgi:GDP-4-dehydro-6-deoxy-D-mannose reductase
MDLTDAHSVRNVIREVKPDKVFHLGAHTYVPTSWSSPAYTFEANVLGTLHILEAVRENCKDAYVQIAGSSEEYGRVLPAECPIREDQPLRPMSPYGVSKIAADKLGYQYARSYGLNICVSRTFNQSGGRRGIDFFDSNWCNQVALMEVGQHKHEIRHGNLDAVRDLSDARDTVQVYARLAKMHKPNDPGVFNCCSGWGVEMSEVLDMLKGLTKVKFTTVQDPARLRCSDVPLLVGSNDKLARYFGDEWEIPQRPYDETLADLLAYWRERVR